MDAISYPKDMLATLKVHSVLALHGFLLGQKFMNSETLLKGDIYFIMKKQYDHVNSIVLKKF